MKEPSKIILIDDSETTNFLNRMVIQKSKYDLSVQEFKSSIEALEYFTENDDLSDLLIFVDINMPRVNGWEVVEEFEKRKVNEKNVIIMLTSSIDKRDEKRALNTESIHGFKTKPLTFEILDEIIGNHFLSPSLSN